MNYQDILEDIDKQLRTQQMAHQKHDNSLLKTNYWKRYTVQRLKSSKKKRGHEVTITEDDLTQPNYCPVLGIKLVYDNKARPRDNSPSVGRIDNTKGYIPGNVHVISMRANQLKSDATVEELLKVANYFNNLIKDAQ